MIKLDTEAPEPAEIRPTQQFVYYLMISPYVVKIGTSANLPSRLNGLRTDAQYIVAIERGGQPLEAQRHKQFAAERLGRRENFQLSAALKHHIESLQPERDELLSIAITHPLPTG